MSAKPPSPEPSSATAVTANMAKVGVVSMDPASEFPSNANPATLDLTAADPILGVRCHRPWGWYEVLAVGEGYQVKRLHLEPNRRFSLQRHHQRSEQWLVVAGEGIVQIGEDSLQVLPGQGVEVPLAAIHRATAGAMGLEIVEVQRGKVLLEDDIERIEDDFGRCQPL